MKEFSRACGRKKKNNLLRSLYMSFRFPLLPQILEIKPCLVNSFQCVTFYESLHINFYFFIAKLWHYAETIPLHMQKQSPRGGLQRKRLWHRCFRFPLNFAKFLRTPFLIEYLRWLFLHRISFCSVFQRKTMPQNMLINHFHV